MKLLRARSAGLPAAVAVCLALTAAGRLSAEPQRLAVDPAKSHVRLELGRSGLLKFMGHEHHIEAPLAAGHVEVADDDPERSSVELRFDAAKLFVIPGTEPAEDIPKVEERMRGPEVLDVAKYPEIVFQSSSVKSTPQDASGFKLVVTGTLTLKGRSVPVEIPLDARRVDGGIEAKGETKLELRDLGIEPPSVAGVVKVSNGFKLEFEIHARP
jgi:polyisoprenoid-binding protein YceI